MKALMVNNRQLQKDLAVGDIIKEKVYPFAKVGGNKSYVLRYYRVEQITGRFALCRSPFGYLRAFSDIDYYIGLINKVDSEFEKKRGMDKDLNRSRFFDIE